MSKVLRAFVVVNVLLSPLASPAGRRRVSRGQCRVEAEDAGT